jgi:argininosuccinate lyase
MDAVQAKLENSYLDATTLMEYMIAQGIPQRTAHHAVGTIVRKAMEQGLPLRDLPLEDIRAECEQLDEQVYGVLGVQNALRTFCSYGSTAPQEVKRQITDWQQRLGGKDHR